MKLSKYNFFSIVILLFLFFVSSCTASNVSSGSQKKPDWVKDRPVSDEYYIGIGMAKTYEDNYTKVAKNNALTDMISEISVKISNNSVLSQFEDESGFKEEFESITKSKMKDELDNHELVDTWEGKDNYWVYYRLSKEKYHKKKQERLDKAKELAKDFYEKAREAEKSYNISNALNYYVKAFDAVKPHLDEDISVFTFDGRINLGNRIYQNIQEIFSSVEFEPDQNEFDIRTLSAGNNSVTATVYYSKDGNKKPVSDLPVVFSFPELDIDKTEQVHSNSSGIITCSIAEMAPKGNQQKVRMALNTDVYFGEETQDNLLKQMFHLRGSVPYDYLILNVTELNAYLEAEEKEFGETSTGKPVTNIFKKALSEDFFSFVPDKSEADVIVKISASTSKGKKMDNYDLHTAYLDCDISITNAKNSAEIYSTGLSNIKGMKGGGFNMAAKDAREKVEKQIKELIIPDLRKMNF
ncbi:MAG: LPP20 family lipoprotein [Bacteroidota bacterium]